MEDLAAETEGTHEPHGVRAPKNAALAGWIGSAIEYKLLLVRGPAALVFPQLFFPSADPQTARLASS